MTLRFIADLTVTRRRQILTASDHKAVDSILCTRPTHHCLMSARFSYRTAELVGKSTSAFDVHVDFPKLKRPGPFVRSHGPYVNSIPFSPFSFDFLIQKVPLPVLLLWPSTFIPQLGFENNQ